MLQLAVNAFKVFGLHAKNYPRLAITWNAKSSVVFRRYSDQLETSDADSSKNTEKTIDNTSYQCQEYYSYNEFSYYDIDSVCVSKRLPQPNADFRDPNQAN